ncbi:uncharacterized protein LOC103514174 [Diaphorina citri]|uniref:Uncharacterized protein LOC103514174 n=1 Tax=Diaphorina citri TaxID=121845 RepID=A0A3Q0J8G7_DIACI|nr:uncharacterized protein LOC103514174 [Diaphorina citri]
MYRAVMEQVLKFLERVQKCLDLIQVNKSTNPNQSPNKNRSRVPRSRSVHTVAHTSPNSRTSSPSPTHQSYHSAHQVQRANSVNHMQDSYSHPLREFSWNGIIFSKRTEDYKGSVQNLPLYSKYPPIRVKWTLYNGNSNMLNPTDKCTARSWNKC